MSWKLLWIEHHNSIQIPNLINYEYVLALLHNNLLIYCFTSFKIHLDSFLFFSNKMIRIFSKFSKQLSIYSFYAKLRCMISIEFLIKINICNLFSLNLFSALSEFLKFGTHLYKKISIFDLLLLFVHSPLIIFIIIFI